MAGSIREVQVTPLGGVFTPFLFGHADSLVSPLTGPRICCAYKTSSWNPCHAPCRLSCLWLSFVSHDDVGLTLGLGILSSADLTGPRICCGYPIRAVVDCEILYIGPASSPALQSTGTVPGLLNKPLFEELHMLLDDLVGYTHDQYWRSSSDIKPSGPKRRSFAGLDLGYRRSNSSCVSTGLLRLARYLFRSRAAWRALKAMRSALT